MEINDANPIRSTTQVRMKARRRRHLLSGINSSAAILLMLVLVAMINYISSRNYLRFDWSRDTYYALSEKTRSLLDSLPERIQITVFIQPGHEIYHHVYEDVINLLREYEYASGNRVVVERVDPDRNIARSEELMTRLELPGPNVVVFEYGERKKVVLADELFEMDYQPMIRGGAPEKVAFRGEQVFSSAILAITEPDRPRVYFLQGHGERDFNDRDDYVGLSGIGQQIRRDDIELEAFSFIRQNTIPEDADALIIAAPTRSFSAGELERIASYLKREGRLILLLNSETDAGFGPLLNEWGVQSVNNLVIDPTRTLSGFDLLVAEYADHPIAAQLQGITTVFYWPRALPLTPDDPERPRAADEPKATALAISSPNAWAEMDIEQRPYRFDDERDIKGPVPVAVAVERGPVESVAVDIRPMRTVVFGDVDFISNSGLSGGNSDLFMNAVNWILERDQLMAVAPRPVNEARLMITRDQLALLFWTVVVAIPALVASFGVLVWWRRRH